MGSSVGRAVGKRFVGMDVGVAVGVDVGGAVGISVGAIVGVNVHVPQLKGQLLMMSACCAALYSVYRASIVAHGPSRVISHSSQGYPR